jgi:hypothetical protein
VALVDALAAVDTTLAEHPVETHPELLEHPPGGVVADVGRRPHDLGLVALERAVHDRGGCLRREAALATKSWASARS